MSSLAQMFVDNFIVSEGETESSVILLEAWSDAEWLGIAPVGDIAQIQVSPDYDLADPGSATWYNVNKLQNGITGTNAWSSGIWYKFKAMGKAIRIVDASAPGADQTVELWKICMVGA